MTRWKERKYLIIVGIVFLLSSFAYADTVETTGIDALLAEATEGDVEAQYNLGMVYGYPWSYGNVVAQDFQEAIEWWTKAAEQGHADAQYLLGVTYEMGNGAAKDLEKAVVWYTKAAEQGHAGAQYSLGLCYENGKGVAKDLEKAVVWYTKAVESAKPNPYVQAQTRLTGAQTKLNRQNSR